MNLPESNIPMLGDPAEIRTPGARQFVVHLLADGTTYCKGHVNLREFAAELLRLHGREVGKPLDQQIHEAASECRHTIARSVPTPYGEFDWELRSDVEPKRGAFKATVWEPRP